MGMEHSVVAASDQIQGAFEAARVDARAERSRG
jgi:hypothetical protein